MADPSQGPVTRKGSRVSSGPLPLSPGARSHPSARPRGDATLSFKLKTDRTAARRDLDPAPAAAKITGPDD